jgi:hypothetical protein
MIANPVIIGGIAFACVFGGALLGMLLRQALPAHHLSTDSKDVMKLGMGLVGTNLCPSPKPRPRRTG